MIIEINGVCYDTEDEDQNRMAQSIYREAAELWKREHSNLGVYVANMNQSFRETQLPSGGSDEPIPGGIDDDEVRDRSTDRVAGGWAVGLLILLVLILYLLRMLPT